MAEIQIRKARPERIRIRLWDQPAPGAMTLELPARRMWPVGLMVGVAFVIFAGVEWIVIRRLTQHSVRDMFDLTFVLFEAFWALGWSVGVVFLGAVAVLLFFYRESARLHEGRLVLVPRLGPIAVLVDYDLAKVRNVRLEPAGSAETVRIKFDYGQGSNGLGDTMSRAEAQLLVDKIKGAAAAAGSMVETAPASSERPERQDRPSTPMAPPRRAPEQPPLSMTSPSGLALIAANLVPLAGVLVFGWDLSNVMVLFWAESVIIAFYTALKMTVVGKLAALLAVPFFIGHFGGFMAGHFLLIYSFFVRGVNAVGPDVGFQEALRNVFVPIRMSLAALFISHGVSFFTNFIGRREYVGATVNTLMVAPYNRIIVMHLALIFGGWMILLLKSPVPALVLFVLIKTVLDFSAHRKEHGSQAR